MSSKTKSSALRDAVRTYRVAPEVTAGFIQRFLESLDCPRALSVWLLFSNNEHEQLVNLECSPHHHESEVQFRAAYSATEFLSKYKRLNLPFNTKEVALMKFEQFEHHCKSVNRRFQHLSDDPLFRGKTVWLHDAVIRKVAEVLGPIPYQEILDSADWGPGATTMLNSQRASHANKFQCETGITRDLYHMIFCRDLFGKAYPSWSQHIHGQGFPTYIVGNKITSVPKNAKTDRIIAIEPGINLWFQKAIGEVMTRKLRRYGIDLRDQGRNQHLALKGSRDSSLATIDFSSASDSISAEVVRSLLPPDWFSLLDTVRSHRGVQGSSSHQWNKFSSMGNGFTFQLESLIFFAIATCCEAYDRGSRERLPVSVYGDDVIVPYYCLDNFVDLSAFYGFIVNRKKSFSSTYFRESCGAHWASGLDVKPFYLKDSLTTLDSVFRAANSVRRLSHRWMNNSACDSRFARCFNYLVHRVPAALRLRIPESLGDGGFISNFDEAQPTRARHSIEGYYVVNLVERAIKLPFEGTGLLLSSLWRLETARFGFLNLTQTPVNDKKLESFLVRRTFESNNTSTLRGRTKATLTRSLVRSWYDLGPWV